MVSSVTPMIPRSHAGEAVGALGERALERLEDDPELLRVGAGGIRNRASGLVLDALVDEERRVAAVVEDHVRAVGVGPVERLLGAPPVLLERLALPGIDGNAGGSDRRRGVILGREDVAGGPADLGAERHERLDQDRGLDGHVERAGDPGALEGLRVRELLARAHEAGHLVLGEADLLAAVLGQAEVGDLEVFGGSGLWSRRLVVMRIKGTGGAVALGSLPRDESDGDGGRAGHAPAPPHLRGAEADGARGEPARDRADPALARKGRRHRRRLQPPLVSRDDRGPAGRRLGPRREADLLARGGASGHRGRRQERARLLRRRALPGHGRGRADGHRLSPRSPPRTSRTTASRRSR